MTMKKILCLCMALVLALGCAAAFAEEDLQAQLDTVETGHQDIQYINIEASHSLGILQQRNAPLVNRQRNVQLVPGNVARYDLPDLLPAEGVVIADGNFHMAHLFRAFG